MKYVEDVFTVSNERLCHELINQYQNEGIFSCFFYFYFVYWVKKEFFQGGAQIGRNYKNSVRTNKTGLN